MGTASLMKPVFVLMTALATFHAFAQTPDGGPPTADSDDIYPIRPANIDCVLRAAQKQGVPANVLLALASVEKGRNGQSVSNTNGSRDIGHFQINTIHWSQDGRLAQYPSITQQDVAWRGCYNAELAAWMLRQHIDEPTGQDFWTRVANYHSKTPKYNAVYRSKLIPFAIRWGNWLQQRYANVSVSQQ